MSNRGDLAQIEAQLTWPSTHRNVAAYLGFMAEKHVAVMVRHPCISQIDAAYRYSAALSYDADGRLIIIYLLPSAHHSLFIKPRHLAYMLRYRLASSLPPSMAARQNAHLRALSQLATFGDIGRHDALRASRRSAEVPRYEAMKISRFAFNGVRKLTLAASWPIIVINLFSAI